MDKPMNGGLVMIALIKAKFALTDQGAKDLIKSSLASLGVYFAGMLPVMLLMLFLERLLLNNDRGDLLYILSAIIVLVVMYLSLLIEYDALYNATYKESANLRIDIAECLRKAPLSYFSKNDTADLAQTIMNDVAAIEHAMSHAMGKAIGFCIFFPVIALLLLLGNVKLGLAVIIPIFANFILLFLSKRIQLKGLQKHYSALRENSDAFQEMIELGQDIKTFSLSERFKKKLYQQIEQTEKIHLVAELSQMLPVLLGNLIMITSIAIVLLVGLPLYLNGEVNLLYLLGYLLASIKIKEGVDMMTLNIAELFYLDAMVKRIKEIRDLKLQEGEDKAISHYDFIFDNVSFGYNEAHKVLNGVSFMAKQGEVTALVGVSGCGKTSILRLMSRLYDYDSGKIMIDGIDLKEISTKSLFEKISIVFQEVILFNTSILENIRLGRKEATDEEVYEAARLAGCEDFIQKLPEGYQTVIGENGASLSGGERQRLSIARAFLKNAPVLILDEIAASLDVENEQKIQESLNLLMKDKTVVIISHRLKSIENVNKIVVLDKGKVECEGTHDSLLKTSKLYQNLVEKAKLAESFRY